MPDNILPQPTPDQAKPMGPEADLYAPQTYRDLASFMGYGGLLEQLGMNKLMDDSGFYDILGAARALKKSPMNAPAEKVGGCSSHKKKKKKNRLADTAKKIRKKKAQHGNPSEKSKVRSAVYGKYPSLNKTAALDDVLKIPDLRIGDIILGGRFKNVKMEVKGIKKDKKGQPVLKTNKGDRKLFSFRINKLLPKAKQVKKEAQVKEAYIFRNTKYLDDIAGFMQKLTKLKSLNAAKKFQPGAKYVGEPIDFATAFPGGKFIKSTGMGSGDHYRVLKGPHSGMHIIQKPHGIGSQVKIKAHRDSITPSGLVGTAKHILGEGVPAVTSQLARTARSLGAPTLGSLTEFGGNLTSALAGGYRAAKRVG